MERMREQRMSTKVVANIALGRLLGGLEEVAGEYSPTNQHASADSCTCTRPPMQIYHKSSSRLLANMLPFLSVKIRTPGDRYQRYLRRYRSLDSYKTDLHLVLDVRAIVQTA